jgi:hypothetical protein
LPSDTAGTAFQNPYQQQTYTYGPSPHQPTGAFGYQPQYTHHALQTQHQHLPPQHGQPVPQQQPQTASPTNPRKRRVSELGGEGGLPGSASSNASAYTNPTGLVTGTGDVELGLGPSQTQLPSPTVKKGRTNTPWTPAEEQRLKALRDAGSSWSEIAKTFPQRTEGSVKKHWYKVRSPTCVVSCLCCESILLEPDCSGWYSSVLADGCLQDMHYAEFAEDEVSSFVRLTAILG